MNPVLGLVIVLGLVVVLVAAVAGIGPTSPANAVVQGKTLTGASPYPFVGYMTATVSWGTPIPPFRAESKQGCGV